MEIKDNRSRTIFRAKSFVNHLSNDVYILGTNKYAISLAEWLIKLNKNVIGFIDDYASENSFNKLPIFKSDRDYTNCSIINSVVEGRTIDVQNKIEELKPISNSDYFALQFAFPDELLAIDFLSNTDSVLEEIINYQQTWSLFEDEQSKNEFELLINFRLNRDIEYLRDFKFRLKEQYFEKFIKLNEDASFIDAGGFDGETSKLFSKLYPNYKHIFIYEPTTESFEKIIKNLKGVEGITAIKKGLWNKTETLIFNDTLGSANKISSLGNTSINVTTIDETVDKHIDYIKMDIEGAELNALIGAKSFILKYKPNLAICVYHNQKDFIEIPKLVLSFNNKYKVYLRHYTQGVFETVMYFVN